jgi:ADP-ribose pyrophosphatase YjhB (NUDIX family)
LLLMILSEGHVLLLKRTYGDKGWSLPGGSVEAGETIHKHYFVNVVKSWE